MGLARSILDAAGGVTASRQHHFRWAFGGAKGKPKFTTDINGNMANGLEPKRIWREPDAPNFAYNPLGFDDMKEWKREMDKSKKILLIRKKKGGNGDSVEDFDWYLNKSRKYQDASYRHLGTQTSKMQI